MSLQETLDRKKEEFAHNQNIPGEIKKTMSEFNRKLEHAGLEEQALHAGQQMTDFDLPEAYGDTYRLSEVLALGPAAVIFFRGRW